MVGLFDETLRVAPQSYWATRMKTEWMLELAPLIDSIGYDKVCVAAGVTFETAVKFLYEDPWERLRLLRKCMPNVTMDVLMRSRNLFGWERYPDEVVELLFRSLKNSGVAWIRVFDGLNDYKNVAAHFKIASKLGLKTSGIIAYSISPVHTVEYFSGKARELVKQGADSITMADASGLMTARQTELLFKGIRSAVGEEVPLEFYVHDCTGLADDVNRTAMQSGVDVVVSSAGPLAHGDSTSSAGDLADIADEIGMPIDLNRRAMKDVDERLRYIAYREKKPVGKRIKFDPVQFDNYTAHQIPGGMMSNFRNQLHELGLIDRIDEFLIEAGRVREELGYPIMVTPFSQFVGVQATFNVMQNERYKTVPKELTRYVMGYYGKSPGLIDPNVIDKVKAQVTTQTDRAEDEFEERILDEYRLKKGPFSSDEDMLLHLFYGDTVVGEMRKNKVRISAQPTIKAPLQVLLEELRKDRSIKSFSLQKNRTRIDLACHAA